MSVYIYFLINTKKIGNRDLLIFITRGSRRSNFQTVYRGRGKRRKLSFSVQFENENDVTHRVQ